MKESLWISCGLLSYGGSSAQPLTCLKTPWWPAPPRSGKSASGATHRDNPQPPAGEFWFIAYHTLYWLDLYLSSIAVSPYGITPPAPFSVPALDADDEDPERPYTKDELLAYLAYTKQKCHSAIKTLTDERARYPYEFPWEKGKGKPISLLELLLYTMRHTQEHAAQLSFFLGQHGIPDEALDWVSASAE